MIKFGTVEECFEHIDKQVDYIISQDGIVDPEVIAFRLGGLAQYTGLLATYFMSFDRQDLSERAQEQYERVIKLTKRITGIEIIAPEEGCEDE